MSRVNLNNIETSSDRSDGSILERLNDMNDSLFCQLLRLGVVLRKRDSAGTPHVIRPTVFTRLRTSRWRARNEGSECGSFTTSMSELDPNFLGLRVRKFNNFGKILDMPIWPDPDIFWANTSFWENGSRLNKCEARSTRDYPSNCAWSESEME